MIITVIRQINRLLRRQKCWAASKRKMSKIGFEIVPLQELFRNLLSTVSVPITCNSHSSILKRCSVQVNESVVNELVEAVCTFCPLGEALAKNGPLASPYKRKQYSKKHFNVVSPVEYNLDSKRNTTFQYIPILPSLQHLLRNRNIFESIIHTHETQENTLGVVQYKSKRDGIYF